MFHEESGWREAQGGVIEVPDVSPEAFWSLLRYLYGSAPELSFENVVSVYVAADKYVVSGLQARCEEFARLHLSGAEVLFLLGESLGCAEALVQLCVGFLCSCARGELEALLASSQECALGPEAFHLLLGIWRTRGWERESLFLVLQEWSSCQGLWSSSAVQQALEDLDLARADRAFFVEVVLPSGLLSDEQQRGILKRMLVPERRSPLLQEQRNLVLAAFLSEENTCMETLASKDDERWTGVEKGAADGAGPGGMEFWCEQQRAHAELLEMSRRMRTLHGYDAVCKELILGTGSYHLAVLSAELPPTERAWVEYLCMLRKIGVYHFVHGGELLARCTVAQGRTDIVLLLEPRGVPGQHLLQEGRCVVFADGPMAAPSEPSAAGDAEGRAEPLPPASAGLKGVVCSLSAEHCHLIQVRPGGAGAHAVRSLELRRGAADDVLARVLLPTRYKLSARAMTGLQGLLRRESPEGGSQSGEVRLPFAELSRRWICRPLPGLRPLRDAPPKEEPIDAMEQLRIENERLRQELDQLRAR